MTLLVFGIPNCSTCKKALQWLDENNVEYQFINTKENPPDINTIASWVKSLGVKSMRNTSGLSYRALGEEKNSWTPEEWVIAFSQDAMLLKRPLFVKENEAVLVGFRANETVKKNILCS
ncbi:arsenate reductase [Geminocystis sp. NIES-3708]|uniref:Spx/MgsR family RNA polymerase-binding regulatory protein n=1 Tax=Geminocystis sp. NIES-3708 TaxID=1615909 RepID=UPI0005FC4D2F|nr:Spx/MgsR family RNA polymerase-binding regulatory protein [Geminocystis sp. NIES-3708]BAQ62941.1 arsenate reductase [Geminocystis sp. NIES-3708]